MLPLGHGHPESAYSYEDLPDYDVEEVMRLEAVPLIDSHCHLDFIYRRLKRHPRDFLDFRSKHSSTFPKGLHSIVNVLCQPWTWQKVWSS